MSDNTGKKKTALYGILLAAALLLIAGFAAIHVANTNAFNRLDRVYRSSEESEACSVEITQIGSWPKEDSEIREVKEGGQFDVTVSNLSEYDISDWTLRINFISECYLNQDWNGKVEIHQNVRSGNETVQTLDLHNFDFDYKDIELEYVGHDKNNLMIHLYRGDYIIYYPLAGGSMGEEYLGACVNGVPGSITSGIIFYYRYGAALSDYELTYHYNKSIFQGVGYDLLLAAALAWLLMAIIFTVWLTVRRKADNELREREAMLEESLDLISHFVDAKDPYTNGHSERVSKYAYKIARQLGFSERKARYAYYAGMLHDVGKCYVPDNILNKPGRLNDEEYKTIKSHTNFGSEMLKGIKSIPGIADGAYYHHERYDGKGYPVGKAGEDIPILARIICVADSFDAMNSTRCYRSQLTDEKIIDELESNKGKQFDPDVAEAMLALIRSGEVTFTSDKQDTEENKPE